MTVLATPSPARLKAARRLARRPQRDRAGRFLAEGPQAVREALRRAGTVVELYATAEAAQRQRALLDEAGATGVGCYEVSAATLGSLAQTVTPQGLVAVCRRLDVTLDDVIGRIATVAVDRPALLVVGADVRDPGNAGSVIRAADAAGVHAVVLAGDSVDPYNGKCVRASAGSLFHVPVVVGVSVDQAVSRLRSAGVRVLAADGRAATDLDDAEREGLLGGPVAWMLGNEAHGLPEPVMTLADEAVAVPIYGRAESLNVATAAAVCLYATVRAQRQGPEATSSSQRRGSAAHPGQTLGAEGRHD